MNPVDTSRPQLKIRGVNLDTGRENVVVISRKSKALRAEIFRGFSRVELRRDSKVLLATLLITDDDALANRLRRLKDFGRSRGGVDIHDTIGYNFKFTELQACIGVEQMKKLPERIERKKAMFRHYKERLAAVPELQLFSHDLQHTVPWFVDALVSRRSELREYLAAKRIGTRDMYPPINRQQAYALDGHHPVSELIGENGLWLPSATQLTDADIDRICAAVVQFYRA